MSAANSVSYKSSVNQHSKGSVFTTLMHIICATIGSGVFALSRSTCSGGWISFALLFVISVILVFSGTLIIECLYYKKGHRLSTYHEIGTQSFGLTGKIIIQIACYINMLGSGWVYIIITGDIFHDLSRKWFKYNTYYEIYYVAVGIAILVPFCLVKSIKEAKLLSLFGTLTTALAVFVICVYCFIDVTKTGIEKAKSVEVISFEKLPFTLATYAFAFGGCVVFPQVEQSMKNRSKWPTAIFISVICIGGVYALISLVGVIAYGQSVESPIYNNLGDSPVVDITKLLVALHFLFATPVYICPFGLEMENALGISKEKLGESKEFLVRVVFRAAIVVGLTSLSIKSNNYDIAMGFIGSISNGILIFLIPSVCYIKLYGLKGHSIMTYTKVISLAIMGVLAIVLGLMGTIKSI